MGITIREIQGLTDDWTDAGREARVLADLWGTSEIETMRAMTQIVYRLRALELSREVEVVFNMAQAELVGLALAREQAAAKVRAVRADLDAAQAELDKVGLGKSEQQAQRERQRSPEWRVVSKLSRGYEEAGKASRDISREYWTAHKKVDVMGKLLTVLRGVPGPDRTILAAMGEALANVGGR